MLADVVCGDVHMLSEWLSSLLVEVEWELSGSSLRTLIPVVGIIVMTNHLFQALPPCTVTLVIWFQHVSFHGDTSIQAIAAV